MAVTELANDNHDHVQTLEKMNVIIANGHSWFMIDNHALPCKIHLSPTAHCFISLLNLKQTGHVESGRSMWGATCKCNYIQATKEAV